MKNQLIYAMAFYVFYMWGIACYMFLSRVKAIKANFSLMKYYKVHAGELPPERAVVIGRHYDNQFQVPILFFITCITCINLEILNTSTIFFAWFFVASRLFHTWIHLGSNKLQHRVVFFALGWITLLLMWAQIVYLTI